MITLKIPEIIQRERRKLKLTQEQLATMLMVSPQAVSNWERGGYPDITLLPRIANVFKITIDELLGNDKANIDRDFIEFGNKCRDGKCSKAEKLVMAKDMYQKYPDNFELMHYLGDLIVENMNSISENIELLKEIHRKIMSGCTDEEYRRSSIHRMCYAATDDELEDLIGNSEMNWQNAIDIGKLREERFILQGRFDEFRRERNSTDLLIFMDYISRYNMDYYGNRDTQKYKENFSEPQRTAAWEKHKMNLLEAFGEGDERIVPEAWCGCYAEASLKMAGALIGCGKLDDGFSQLEKTFELYDRWLKIPYGKQMDFGNHDAFGKVTVNKLSPDEYISDITSEDGYQVWAPYLWLFWQTSKDIQVAMTQWIWFDIVKEDDRYVKLLESAEKLVENKE